MTTTADNPTPCAGEVTFADEAARALLASRAGELSSPTSDWELVKRNASRSVYRGLVDGQAIYLKHFHSRSRLHRMMSRLGGGEARCEMLFAQHLSRCGVPTPDVLAYRNSGGVEWLATREVAPSEQGDTWHVRQLARGAEGQAKIRRMAARLGRLIGRMHASGVFHRDLHCGNVLVRTDVVEPVLMDLHRATRRRQLSRRSCAARGRVGR